MVFLMVFFISTHLHGIPHVEGMHVEHEDDGVEDLPQGRPQRPRTQREDGAEGEPHRRHVVVEDGHPNENVHNRQQTENNPVHVLPRRASRASVKYIV
eukprot:8836740-Pyramimonas_sp.AAC.1